MAGGHLGSGSRICEGTESQESLKCSGSIHLARGRVDWGSQELFRMISQARLREPRVKSQLYLVCKGDPDTRDRQVLRRKVILQTARDGAEQGEAGGRETGPQALARRGLVALRKHS